MVSARQVIESLPPQRFDIICAGQPVWHAWRTAPGHAAPTGRCALVNVTRMLTHARLHLGLVTTLEDDRFGRTLRAELAALGVEVGALTLASVDNALVVVDASGGWSGLVSGRNRASQLEIPPSWSAQVLLLSGLTPVTSSLAALCKAARKARRDGTVVVLDLVGGMRDWAGHDPRLISMVLREADVVRCSFFDLAVIGINAHAVRQAMRSNATMVLDDDGGATAMGMFGEVRVQASSESSAATVCAEGYTAAICVEYARPKCLGETPGGRWQRVLGDEAPKLIARQSRLSDSSGATASPFATYP